MGVIYILIKIFPFFGIALTVLCADLARTFKRKGNPAWIGMIFFGLIFIAMTITWGVLRGDRNADIWFRTFSGWLGHP